MSDTPRTASSRRSRHQQQARAESGPPQWISPVLAVAAVALGVSVDVHSVLPLRPSGRVIFMIACGLLALALSRQVSGSIRRLTGVIAAITVLLMVTLWFGYRVPSAPVSSASDQLDTAELIRERNEDVRDSAARSAVRVITPTYSELPNWQLFTGHALRLGPPMGLAGLRLDADRGQLVGHELVTFVLTAATISGARLSKATTATIRRTLIAVPARIASSARRLTLYLPAARPWEHAWTTLFPHACGPP